MSSAIWFIGNNCLYFVMSLFFVDVIDKHNKHVTLQVSVLDEANIVEVPEKESFVIGCLIDLWSRLEAKRVRHVVATNLDILSVHAQSPAVKDFWKPLKDAYFGYTLSTSKEEYESVIETFSYNGRGASVSEEETTDPETNLPIIEYFIHVRGDNNLFKELLQSFNKVITISDKSDNKNKVFDIDFEDETVLEFIQTGVKWECDASEYHPS